MSRDEHARDYGSLLDAVVAAADAAAAVIRRGAAGRTSLVWENKGPADFVTDVDRGAEEALRRVLAERALGVPLFGEESWEGEIPEAGFCFVADPLDGTTNFLHGVPEYAVSIAALEDGEPVAGVVLNAARGDRFTARRGGGAFLDGAPIRVSTTSDPARALIATGFPFKAMAEVDRYAEQFKAVARETSGIRRPGAAALDFANLAAGRYDAFWELTLAPWDIAAGVLLIREAGGVVTDIDGGAVRIADGGFVAGNPHMHAWLLETLRRADGAHGARTDAAGTRA